MNRIFKVVWNEIRGSYMVCDENRVARGKTKSVKTALAIAAITAMTGLCGIANANPVVKSGTIYSFAGVENNTAKIYENSFEGASLKDNGDGSITVTVDAENQSIGMYGVLTNMYTNTSDNLDVATSGLNITDSNFANVTTTNAGAVVLWNNKDSETGATLSSISNSSFANNHSDYGGGAISVLTFYDGQNPVDLNVTNSTFEKNSSLNGGAIFNETNGTKISISNSSFESNSARSSGGAIFVKGKDTIVTVSDSIFSGNSANGNNGGGAIMHGSTMTITDSIFTNNTSQVGGAISIGTDSKETVVTGSTFENNHAIYDGGAIGNYGGLSITNSTFTGNTAQLGQDENGNWTQAVEDSIPVGGGAISLGAISESKVGTITGTKFINNKSGKNGGAIGTRLAAHADNSVAKLDIEATFEGNEAVQNGGAIYNTFYANNNLGKGDGVTVKGTFTENKAGQNGGAIYNDGSKDKASNTGGVMTLADSTFTGNSAATQGGAIYNSKDAKITFTGANTFSGNTANGIANDIHNAGTITVASGTTTLDGGITGNGTVDIDGGKLVAPTIHADANTINLKSGTLQTGSEQVMATGLNAEGTTTDAGGLKEGTRVTYTGGELALTDAKYNLDYAKSVAGYINNDGATAVTMLGELVGQTGPVTVSDLEDTGVVLATEDIVANEDNKTGLVIGIKDVSGLDNINGNNYTDAETHNNNLGAKTLTLANGGEAVLVTSGKTLTLIGDGTDLIRTDDGSVNVDIGHDSQSGTLNLGTDSAANGGTLSGTVTVSETGTVNVNGAEYGVNGKLDVSGTVNVNNGATLNTDTVTLNNGGTVNVAGTMKADTLTAAKETTINVGDSTSAGSLSASSLSLNGGMMFLDPDWRPGIGIEGASRAAFGSLPNGIDGSLVVGRNSLAVLGDTTTDWAQNEFARSGRNWGPGDITAALAIQAPQTLSAADNGAIVVDGSLTAPSQTVTSNSVRFADNSMLTVDAAGIGSEAAITGNGTSQATVADSAALHIANARNGQEIGILRGFTSDKAINGWQGDNLTSSDAMISLNVTEDGSNGNVTVAATANNAADIFPGAMPVSTMNAIWQNGENDVDSANGGIAFLSRAADNRYLNHQDAVRTINGAAQMAVAAGVQLSNLQALDSVTEALENHVSLTANTQQANAPRLHDEGADLWAAMLYRHDSGDGMKSGSFNADINNNFGGLIVGSDYTWKLAGDTQTRVGAALSIGKGDSHSDGDYNYSKNDYDTYGINLYGSWNNRNVNIMADIGYMKGDNEVEQHLSQNLGGKLKADVDTEMWTAGIKGEYRIRTSALDITPHLGVRYTHLKTDSFSSRNTLGTVFNTDSESYNIWQMPLGVTLSKDYKSASGWTIKPKFDFSVIGAAGDMEAETRVRVPGVNAADNASADMMDSVSFRGIVGVEMQKDATSVGLSAGYQRSATMNSTGFMLNIGHHF